MENSKKPYYTISGNFGTEYVENYMYDFNKSLQQLCQQHDEIIQKSVSIMKEINKVLTSENGAKSCATYETLNVLRISNCTLISEEDINVVKSSVRSQDTKAIKESIQLLKRTQGSLEKLETFLNGVAKGTNKNTSETDIYKELVKCQLNQQSKPNNSSSGDLTKFKSCCSSEISLKPQLEADLETDQIFYDAAWSITDIGYQGDIDDSDYDPSFVDKQKWLNF